MSSSSGSSTLTDGPHVRIVVTIRRAGTLGIWRSAAPSPD
jgi:hypothetical protein